MTPGLGPIRRPRSAVGRFLVVMAGAALVFGAVGFAIRGSGNPTAGRGPAATTGSTGSATWPATATGQAGGSAAGASGSPASLGEAGSSTSPLSGAIGGSGSPLGTGSPFGTAPGTARSATSGGAPRLLGPLDPSTTVDFALALRMPDQAAIDAYLDSLYDPRSSNYRHFLSAAEFGARFGLPLSRIAGLEAWARAAGLTVVGGYDQRTALRLEGTAGVLTRVFGVRLANYVDPKTGVTFHAPLNESTLPPEIADAVAGLAGLDTRPFRSGAVPKATVPAPRAVPSGGMGPVDLAKAYDIVPLYTAGYLGEGQVIAVVSFDTYNPDDITEFDKEYGIDGPAPKRVAIGKAVPKPGNGAVEVTLDVEILRAVAPHAQILNFEGQNGKVSQTDIFDAIVQDGRADIVSDSWGRCDTQGSFNTGDRARGMASLQAAAAKGVSVFVASGDNGVFDCWARDPTDQRETVDYPSSSPYTISVGGTHLWVRDDGTYLSEAGWEDYLTTAGTGGGLNPTEKRPTWQKGPGVENDLSNGNRQSPDVAAAGDPETGYRIRFTDPDSRTADWVQIGGTSAAAPFWAGSMALVRQLALHEGVGRLGFVDPMLYELAAGTDGATLFHDVAQGGNLDQTAGPGWDYATGLGSPDVTALAGAIVAYLNQHPVK